MVQRPTPTRIAAVAGAAGAVATGVLLFTLGSGTPISVGGGSAVTVAGQPLSVDLVAGDQITATLDGGTVYVAGGNLTATLDGGYVGISGGNVNVTIDGGYVAISGGTMNVTVDGGYLVADLTPATLAAIIGPHCEPRSRAWQSVGTTPVLVPIDGGSTDRSAIILVNRDGTREMVCGTDAGVTFGPPGYGVWLMPNGGEVVFGTPGTTTTYCVAQTAGGSNNLVIAEEICFP